MCALLWIVFCVLHSVFASGWVKRKTAAVLPAFMPWYRLAYTLFAFVSLAAVVWYQFKMNSPLLFARTALTNGLGVLIGGAGLLVMALCIKKYFLGLSGLKSLFHAIPAHQLIISGMHRHVRHPLYAGTFLAIWGLFVVLPYGSLLVSNTIITVYTIMAIEFEEQKLVAEFGDDYHRYREQVPKIIPFFRTKQG